MVDRVTEINKRIVELNRKNEEARRENDYVARRIRELAGQLSQQGISVDITLPLPELIEQVEEVHSLYMSQLADQLDFSQQVLDLCEQGQFDAAEELLKG